MSLTDEQLVDNRPSPDDILNFIPWACGQLLVNFVVVVDKEHQHEYVSVVNQDKKKNKSKPKLQSRMEIDSNHKRDNDSEAMITPVAPDSKVFHILAICDHADNLTQLTFVKNSKAPRVLWKIIGLIVKYHPYLANITINGGMDQYTLYEISKFLNISNITELILDNSVVPQANFYLLFESDNCLYHISLAGCQIDDDVVQTITVKLVYSLPASKKLTILNLASNKITDYGAKLLADALRSNRRLSYLNLSNNRLTDKGARHIFSSLNEFKLTKEELMATRTRQMDFLKKKNDYITKALQELRTGDIGKASKRRTVRAVTAVPTKRKLEKEASLKSFADGNVKSLLNIDVYLYEKAVGMAELELGEFEDPFNSSNIVVRDKSTYCIGNNSLCYLNLSYNNLSYLCLKNIIDLLKYQKSIDRKPSGLVNLIIEGNPLPILCDELIQIDQLIESGLASLRRMSIGKKRGLPLTKR